VEPQQSTFIVGSGRFGSTLVSRMLADCPDIVSISELFAWCSDIGALSADDLFPERDIDGDEFWEILSARGKRTTLLLRNGCRIPEILYPLDDTTRQAGLPAILLSTLPHLSGDPGRLYEELAP